MSPLLIVFLTSLAPLAAGEDSWAKVRQLSAGAELRIHPVNAKKPFLASFDRANGESLVVTTKKGQISIAREEIERLECRPAEARRLVKQTRVDRQVVPKGAEMTSNKIPGGTTTVKTDLNLPGRKGFEEIYRRPADGN